VGPALFQVVRQASLGQESIGGDSFSLDVDGIEQGLDHADFIGILHLIPVALGQSAYFFWV
jgi:hypothetical protein